MINILKIEKDDLQKLQGKFIIEVNNDDQKPFETQSKGFLIEKRISFLVVVGGKMSEGGGRFMLAGFYCPHSSPLNEDQMVDKINNPTEGRHVRLLTPKELKVLMGWMQEDLINMW